MKKNPSVGIVTRTKNRGVLLRRALESVVNQTYENWKLIVVNDGGEKQIVDQLVEKHTDFKDKIMVVHNVVSVGMEAASNLALKELDTDYAVIHDDDDTWSPSFLERLILLIDKEKEVIPAIEGIVCYSNRVLETVRGNSVIIDSIEHYNHWIPAGLVSLDRMLYQNMFPPISFIFSLDKCRELGFFNEELPVLGDWDFHVRFLLNYDILVVPEPMAFYHHRLDATGALGNTVIAGQNDHLTYRNLLLNKWLRDDLNGKGNGLGIYANQRAHFEFLLNSANLLSRLLEIASRLNRGVSKLEMPVKKVLNRVGLWK